MATAAKKATVTVVTTEVYEVGDSRVAAILACYANSTQDMWPEGGWGIPELPQVGESKYEVTVDE